MAKYRPRVVSKSSFYEEARVMLGKVQGKPSVKIVFASGIEVVLNKNNCPPYVQSGEFVVTLNSDRDKMLGMRPVEGIFPVRVKSYTAKENEPPKPRMSRGEYPSEYFIVLLEITRGKEKGMVVPFSLKYNFILDRLDEKDVIGYSKSLAKSPPTAQLAEFLELTGTWEFGAIPYKDNILPILEKRQLRAKKEFNVLLKNGFVDSLFALQELKEETLEEELMVEEELVPLPELDEEELPWEDA